MNDPLVWLGLAAAALAGLAMLSLTGLKAWDGWIALQRQRLQPGMEGMTLPSTTAARIELADLRERVRKLEAIAAGVDY